MIFFCGDLIEPYFRVYRRLPHLATHLASSYDIQEEKHLEAHLTIAAERFVCNEVSLLCCIELHLAYTPSGLVGARQRCG